MTTRTSGLIAIALSVFVCLTCLASPSYALIHRNDTYEAPQRTFEDQMKETFNSIPYRYTTIFTDENNGAELGKDWLLAQDKSNWPEIYAINIEDDVDSLHSDKSCNACAKIKDWYEKDEIKKVYNFTISANEDITWTFALGLPWEQKTDILVYQCIDGELQKLATTATDDTLWIETKSQSPFAVVDAHNNNVLKDFDPSLYTPDDEDNEEEKDPTLMYLLVFGGLLGVGFYIGHRYRKRKY